MRRKIAIGEIPAVRLGAGGRGAVRIPEDELHAWLRQVVDEPDAAA